MVQQDPSNAVLGEPENFIKALQNSDDQYFTNAVPYINGENQTVLNHIKLRFETAECQVNFTKLKQYLRYEIATNPNITCIHNTEITSLDYLHNKLAYQVSGFSIDSQKLRHNFTAEGMMIFNCNGEGGHPREGGDPWWSVAIFLS